MYLQSYEETNTLWWRTITSSINIKKNWYYVNKTNITIHNTKEIQTCILQIIKGNKSTSGELAKLETKHIFECVLFFKAYDGLN